MTMLVSLAGLLQNAHKPIMLRGPRSNLYIGQSHVSGAFLTNSIRV